MKKFLPLVLATMLAFPVMAIGRGDGSTKANAIEFDWAKGSVQEVQPNAVWYRVPLDTIYHEEVPTLAIFLTNLTDNPTHVHIQGTLAGQTETRDYTLAAHEQRVWLVAGGMLVQMKQTEVYLCLKADQRVAICAKVYETSDIDDACLSAVDFNWNAGVVQPAATTEWYKVDLRAAKAATTQEVTVSIHNRGTSATIVTGGVSFDCPSTGLTSRSLYLNAGETQNKTISRALLDALSADEAYVRLASEQPVEVTARLVNVAASATPVFDGTSATEAFLNTPYNVGGGVYIYKIKLSSLRQKGMMPELTVANQVSSKATVKAEVAFEAKPYSVTTRTMTLGANEQTIRVVEPNLLDGIGAEYVYVRLTTDEPLAFSGRLRRLHEGEACKTAADFVWNKEHRQSANTTVWYAVDIQEAKANKNDVLLHVKNVGNQKAALKGSIAFECPYGDLQVVSRSLAAQTQVDKTLSWNLFGMMSSDIVYIGVETNQDVVFSAEMVSMPTKEKDDACLLATEFDWNYGHKQAAKDTVWYKVGLARVRNTSLLPTITINNLGSTTARMEAEMSLECPDSVANTVRRMALAAGDTYTKTIGRDFINGIDKSIDTLYFRVISSEPISFRVTMAKEDAGSSCASAVLFNWVSGNDQKAGDNLWYMVDLRAAKAGKQDIRVSITNKDNTRADVAAQVAFSCPCEAPQKETTSLNGLQTKSKTIAHSALETLGDTVYVRLSSSQAVHVEAELVDPEPFTPIDCPEDMVAFDWGNNYTTTADTTWYYVSKTVLDSLNKTTKTPRIYLKSTDAQVVTAHVAYHCPIAEAMQSKSVSVGAGQELYKVLERATAEQLVAKHDSILVRLVGKNLTFRVDLVDPNTGEDCLHAINYAVGDTTIQDETTVRWYRLDKKAVVALNKLITFSIENLGAKAGTLQAELYTSCDSAAIMAEPVSLGSGQKRSKEFSSDIFSAFGSDYLYMKITTRAGQQLRITSSVRDFAIVEPITACAEAIEAVPNTTYEVAANTPTWYAVDIRNLQENTIGNGKLTINNMEGTPVTAKTEISWVCPVEHEMTYRQETIAGNGALVYTVERTQFNAFDSTRVYVRVSADRKISFRFDITMSKGDECTNAINFDWKNGNVHPGSSTEKTNCLWYQVLLDSTAIPEGYDMQLSIVNLDKQQPTETSARIMWECESEIKSLERTISAGDTIRQTIDRDVIKQAGWPNLQILYCSDKTTKIFAELVPETERVQGFDTIYATVCDGSAYTDSVFVGDKWYYINMMVFDDDVASQKLDTTISWRDGTAMRDSVITYKVTPLVAASRLTPKQLDSIGAMPLLVEGMSLFVEPSLVALRHYYDAIDTIAKTGTIYWSDDSKGRGWAGTTTIIPKNTRTKTLYLHIGDSCENEQNFAYTFLVAPWRTDSVVMYDTVCPNTASVLCPETVISKDTTIRITKSLTVADTLGRQRTMDSVYVYTVTVKKAPALYTELPSQPTVVCGKPIATDRTTGRLMTKFAGDRDGRKDVMAVTAVVWQRKDTSDNTYAALSAERLGKDEKKVILRYVALTECGDSLFSQDFDFVPEAYIYKESDVIKADVCAGSEYVSRLGSHIIQNDTVWNDTLTIHDTEMDFDSVYMYDIHVFVAPVLYTNLTVNPTVACGKSIDANAAAAALKTRFAADKSERTMAVTSVVWQRKDTLNNTYAALSAERLGKDEKKVILRYVALSECGDSLFSQDFDFVPEAYIYKESDVIKADVCAGSEYVSRLGSHIIQNDTVWNDTLTIHDTEMDFDSVYVYNITALKLLEDIVEHDTICDGDVYAWRDGSQFTESGIYYDTVRYEAGCDKERYTLYLTVLKATDKAQETASIKQGQTYVWHTWRDQTLTEAGTYHDTAHYTTGCDSVRYTLVLTVEPAPVEKATVTDTVCAGSEYISRLGKQIVYNDTTWTEKVTVSNAVTGDVDSVYTYQLTVYHFFMPSIPQDSIWAVCGQTIDTTHATAFILQSISADPLFAPEVAIRWMVLEGSSWMNVVDKTINGQAEVVTVKCEIRSECAGKDTTLVIAVEQPDADNDAALRNLPAKSMYSDRLLMINLNLIQKQFPDWTITESDVHWYKMTGNTPDTSVDTEVGVGYYYTTPNAEQLSGQYYATIVHTAVSMSDCSSEARTVILTCAATNKAPELRPTLVQPNEQIQVLNLNPYVDTEIHVYTSTGQKVATYTSRDAEVFLLKAASDTGYYMVDVRGEGEKITLRYVVK